jgi:voltage-gated potassium channel
MTIRKTLSSALDPSVRTEPGLSRTNTWVVILICLSIALGIAETEVALTAGFEHYYDIAHLVFFGVFLAEYIARVYAAPENPRYGSSLS